ncbi:FAD-dependent oxidoreductase [Sphaerisporangium album]|uniref:FAD-dependent oxidoreductase n=1 Tax=Sphaerisporangium album TaxID=509200 RepID=A0A367FHW7_9ACTN|nr:FAD-dependent monooxygenase [Sphaerisporangium album]RCG29884.1 FAD-dependent oxidoreductase [Sphaerisporangium album]
MNRAIVLGGGFAGVLAAAVLARHADDVILIETDRYPPGPRPRRGLPQSHHNHVLVTGGARALQALLPGTLEALYARGAHRRGLSGGALILAAQGWFRRIDTEAYLVACSRGLLDQVVRERALGGGAVSVWEGAQALGLVGDATRVTGVRAGRVGGPARTFQADLVVDATGRRSKAPRWLAELGAPDVEEAGVTSGLAYSTRVYQAPPELAGGVPAIMIHPGPAQGRPAQGATLFPIEDDRWVVTLTGTRGGEPPADEQGFTRFARCLRHPIVADLMAAATPLGGVRPYRDTANRRRFYERARLPAGFLATGDAVVAVNPVHSHGMSVAALGALRLDRELTRRGFDPSLTPDLQAAVAAEAETSWRMAVRQDGGHAGGADERREASAFERRIRTRLARAALSSPELAADLFHAQTLIQAEARTDTSSRSRALRGEPDPLLSSPEAIAQFPGLHAWWLSRSIPPVTPVRVPVGGEIPRR